jgi:hypothetical protein
MWRRRYTEIVGDEFEDRPSCSVLGEMDIHVHIHLDLHTDIQMDMHTDIQLDIQMDIQMDIQLDKIPIHGSYP